MTTKKKTRRRVALTAGQAMQLQAAVMEARAAETRVQAVMDGILAASSKGEPSAQWMLEVEGDDVALVEVLPDA
jgi:hypothetical protein